jgi:hypothetical protein
MESANLNPRSNSADDPLDALLRQPLAPLRGDDFTRGVLSALPPRRNKARATRARGVFIAVGAIAGVTLAIFQFPSLPSSAIDWAPAQAAIGQMSSSFSDPTVLLTMIVAAVSVLYALGRFSLRRQ